MEVGVAVWVRSERGGETWVPSVIQSKGYSPQGVLALTAVDEYGESFHFTLGDESEELPNVKLRNDNEEMQVDNLISLPYLHEPAILYCLQQRYSLGDIYTYTGPILIAMNPFKSVPLYTDQILEVYYNEGLLRSQGISSQSLPPHVYAIADAAYRDMTRVVRSHTPASAPSSAPNTARSGSSAPSSGPSSSLSAPSAASTGCANQSVLISGESGAGKTESTKIVLRYLTTVGNSGGGMAVESGSVMDKVLQSNPILEAFGNARTVRNDNSSRFGKFIELSFSKRGHLIGGLIRTYLLEKVRLPSQQKGERNFHIFYQIAAGASAVERARWGLAGTDALPGFEYARRGGVLRLKSMDDGAEFRGLKQALKTLNFDPDDQTRLLDVAAALLHLGQVQFKVVPSAEGEGSAVCEECADSLLLASQLLGLEVDKVVRCLTVRTIVARDDSYEKKLTRTEACDARDALAKALYGRLFDWIVRTINLSIRVDSMVRSSIGVLDIFGFECFAHNSFEQLCINYTNETLQQQFNQYIFKMEQIEYQREQINWSFIEFPDNQDCLDLIEHRVSGILAMVDDECRLPAAKDEKLAARMYKAYEGHGRFSATPTQRRDFRFCVRHYAGAVVYSALSFVEKNKDELPREATALLQGSSVPLLCNLFSDHAEGGGGGGGVGGGVTGKMKSPTVGAQFKEQLQTLMESVYATTPHYIRCLKPNDENVSDNFSRLRITEQLRYGGVLEAVRVARSGFPVRLAHLDFYARYRPLANPFSPSSKGLPAFSRPGGGGGGGVGGGGPGRALIEQLIDAVWDETVPTPTPTSAPTSTPMHSQASELSQWGSRAPVARQSVQLGLTKVFLRKPAHDMLESRRSRRIAAAARRIQCAQRGRQGRAWYCSLLRAVRLLQRVVRGLRARCRARDIRERRAAVKLQRQVRRYAMQWRYVAVLCGVLRLQARARGVRGRALAAQALLLRGAVKLQRMVRGLLRRCQYCRLRWAVVCLQNRHRKAQSKCQLRLLKEAARDVGRLRQSNEALKSEIDALRARAAEESENRRVEGERVLREQMEEDKREQLGSLQAQLAAMSHALAEERAAHVETTRRLGVAEQALTLSPEPPQSHAHAPPPHHTHAHTHTHAHAQQSQSALPPLSHQAPCVPPLAPMPPPPAEEEGGIASGRDGSGGSGHRSRTNSDSPSSLPSSASPAPTGSAPSSRRSSRAIERRRSAASPTPAAMGGGGGGGGGVGGVYMLDPVLLSESLEREVQAREALEGEVARLRSMCLDYQAQMGAGNGVGGGVGAGNGNGAVGAGAVGVGGVGGQKRTSLAPTARPRTPPPQRLQAQGHGQGQGQVQWPGQTSAGGSAGGGSGGVAGGIVNEAQWHDAWDDEEEGRHSDSSRETTTPSSSASTPPVYTPSVYTSAFGRGGSPAIPSQSNPLQAAQAQSQAQTQADKQQRRVSGSATGSAVVQAAAATASHAIAHPDEMADKLAQFERNLLTIRGKLQHGVRAFLWEGQRVSNEDMRLRLCPLGKTLTFEPSARSTLSAFFKLRVDVPPVSLIDVSECLAGAEVGEGDQGRLLTIVCSGGRILALLLETRDVRNAVLGWIRALTSDAQFSPAAHTAELLREVGAQAGAAGQGQGVGGQGGQVAGQVVGQGVGVQGPGPVQAEGRRRLSVREAVLEQAHGLAGAAGAVGSAMLHVHIPTLPLHIPVMHRGSLGGGAATGAGAGAGAAAAAAATAERQAAQSAADKALMDELQKVLLHEQRRNGTLLMQMVVSTNELADREEQVALLKKREEHYEQALTERDNMYKQDTTARMQLARKFEEVLMDKEEAYEELAALREQLEAIKLGFK